MFMQGDLVRYVGQKFFGDFKKKDIKRGEVIARVGNQDGVYVVEFGDDSFVMPESSLQRYIPSKKDLETAAKEPEVTVQKKQRRRVVEENAE
jgi:hypothetical protein